MLVVRLCYERMAVQSLHTKIVSMIKEVRSIFTTSSCWDHLDGSIRGSISALKRSRATSSSVYLIRHRLSALLLPGVYDYGPFREYIVYVHSLSTAVFLVWIHVHVHLSQLHPCPVEAMTGLGLGWHFSHAQIRDRSLMHANQREIQSELVSI
jgi:hypothetical protein